MTATSAPIRVCVYVRYSADMQSPRSCDDQIRECTAYAEGEGWEVVLVQRDDAVRAGAIAGRAGYGRVVAAAKAGQFQVLLVEEHNRFSRDFWGGLAEVASLRKVGVRLADTKNGIVDADSAFGQLRLAFSLVTSQQETQRLGERSKRGLKGKVLQRFSGGGRPPYGYKRAPVFSEVEVDVDGRARRIGVRFEPDAAEGPVALRIFQMYAEGVSKHAIAIRFNREGIPTREAGTMRRGVPCSGTWCAATVKGVLENQVYVGTFYWNQTSRLGDKHAYSGKKEQVPNPEKDWVKVDDFVTPLVTARVVGAGARAPEERPRKLQASSCRRRDSSLLALRAPSLRRLWCPLRNRRPPGRPPEPALPLPVPSRSRSLDLQQHDVRLAGGT